MALTDNLVSYWKMENNVTDEQSAGNDGTNNGATFVAGNTGFGQALSFDGTNDYVDFGSTIVGTGAKTVSAWIKWDTVLQTYGIILGNTLGGAGLNAGTSWAIYNNGGTQVIHMNLGDGIDGDQAWEVYPALPVNTNWHHYAMVHNGTDLRAYVDGVLVDTETNGSGNSEAAPSHNFRLGRSHNGASFEAYGKFVIDELAIWNRALTAQEVTDIYNNGSDGLLSVTVDGSGISITVV